MYGGKSGKVCGMYYGKFRGRGRSGGDNRIVASWKTRVTVWMSFKASFTVLPSWKEESFALYCCFSCKKKKKKKGSGLSGLCLWPTSKNSKEKFVCVSVRVLLWYPPINIYIYNNYIFFLFFDEQLYIFSISLFSNIRNKKCI